MAEELKPSYSLIPERLYELERLFPEAFEDGKLNVDTLKELIGDFSTDSFQKEHYGLNWVGKIDARRIAGKAATGTLKPCQGIGVNEDKTENIFIEGENLEVLKILRRSYAERIKMIYIDPPYNTGNDFIYKDDFSDSTEDYLRKSGEKSDEGLLVSNPKSTGKYHANWLSFMYPRLRLAKDLLQKDGLIFISIDDNELSNLSLLCNEIFGEENYVTTLVWQSKKGGGGDSQSVVVDHEYVLMYAKSIDDATFGGVMAEAEPLDKEDEHGKYRVGRELNKWGGSSRRQDRPTMWFPIKGPGNVDVYPIRNDGTEGRWRYGKDNMEKFVNDGNVEFVKREDGSYIAYEKIRTTEPRIIPYRSWLSTLRSTAEGSIRVRELFGATVFSFPKPVSLIERLMEIALPKPNGIVCDFFAGSCSTADTVMNYNQKHQGNVSYIAIQIPEKIGNESEALKLGYNNIAEIGRDRIKKVIEELTDRNDLFEKDLGFKVFKHDKSNIFKWQEFDPNKQGGIFELNTQLELSLKNPLQDGTSKADFVTEVMLQEGFPLTAKQETLKNDLIKVTSPFVPFVLYICWTAKLNDATVKDIKFNDSDHFVCLDKSFAGNDSLKQTLDNSCKLITI
jgi:adenine-specific DNA-methyltransferase